jgi:hypothetical protein
MKTSGFFLPLLGATNAALTYTNGSFLAPSMSSKSVMSGLYMEFTITPQANIAYVDFSQATSYAYQLSAQTDSPNNFAQMYVRVDPYGCYNGGSIPTIAIVGPASCTRMYTLTRQST